MARTVAELPKGARITGCISLGVLTKTVPLDKVMAAVAAAGKTNQRQRDLPAHVLFGTRLGGYREGEIALAHKVGPSLKSGMLCLADRNFSWVRCLQESSRHRGRSALQSQKESAPAV